MMFSQRKQSIKDHFDNIASNYPTYRNRFAYYARDTVNYLNFFLHENNSILEIGCSHGQTLSQLKGKNKTGIDFSEKMIAIARQNYPDCRFLVMDAEQITLTEKFDVIILNNVIGYLENIQEALQSIQKNCHSSTKVIISYYNHLWEPLLKLGERIGFKKRSPEQNWLDSKDIANLLYLSGFETYRTDRRLLIPVGIPVVSGIFNKYLSKLPFFKSLCLNKFLFARPVHQERTDANEQHYSVSVCIPARNESGNIENAILRMPQFSKHIEIIFVEGNSTDNTWEKIQEIQQKYQGIYDIKCTQQTGKGKGDAVRKGYSIASGDILMILDADLTMPPEELPKFYEAIASGKGEFINGSRLVYPMEKEAMRWLNTLGNKFFSLIFSWMLEQPIKDTLCGTKVMFRNDYIRLTENRSYFGNFDPFGDYDLLFGAYKLNLKIIDLPIRYKERTYGDTNISRFKHGWLLLKMCWFAAGKIKFK